MSSHVLMAAMSSAWRRRAAAGLAFMAGHAAAQRLHMTVPPPTLDEGGNPIGGWIEGMGGNPGDYKVVLYISGDFGTTWWDKMHNIYYGHYPDAGERQQAGIPINADWSWYIDLWPSPGAQSDRTSALFRAYVIPQSYNLKWPAYQVEGENIPGTLIAASAAGIQINRQSNQVLYFLAGGQVDDSVTGALGTDGVGVAPPPGGNNGGNNGGGNNGGGNNNGGNNNGGNNPTPTASVTPSQTPPPVVSHLPWPIVNDSCQCRVDVGIVPRAQFVVVNLPARTTPVNIFGSVSDFEFYGINAGTRAGANGNSTGNATSPLPGQIQCDDAASTSDVRVTSATVAIVGGYQSGQDSLRASPYLTSTGAFQVSYSNAQMIIRPSVNSWVTLTAMLRAMVHVQYANSYAGTTAYTPTPGVRTIQISVVDDDDCSSVPMQLSLQVNYRPPGTTSDAASFGMASAAALAVGAVTYALARS